MGVLLVTMIQMVGVSAIALVIPRLYVRDWDKIMVDSEGGEVEKCQLVKVDN